MNILKTDRTYKTAAKALQFLKSTLCIDDAQDVPANVHYLIAVNEEGRFAPVVLTRGNPELTLLCHKGVTVV